jgi:crotonobetainyl-CoA:carnitine CoA-transferase CaiB-like acyl-CoA transferase
MRKHVFAGINVVEFTGFAAGPVVGKHLADHGAQVVRVESTTRPDGFRTHYPPFTDNRPGLNRSGCFALFNNNKYSITLNLRLPKGVELAKRLVAWADAVIENFTPGTMKRLGLDYQSLRQVRPDIVMLSTCNQGQTGPHAHHPGFGSHLSSLSGFTNLIGYPDRPPAILYGPYIDFIGGGYGVIALVAALDYRRRTGHGMYIDLAQYETGLQFLIPVLLDYELNGRVAQRQGNRSSSAAPHGAYPCRGEDRWCVISVHSDEEWVRLRQALGDPPWARDPSFDTLLGRKDKEEELDAHLARWTAEREPREVMERLQAAGVHAAAVNNMADLYSDPQLAFRHTWWPMTHAEMGNTHYEGPPFLLSETPAESRLPAPCLGEHNRYVCGEILGLTEEEFERLVAEGVIA